VRNSPSCWLAAFSSPTKRMRAEAEPGTPAQEIQPQAPFWAPRLAVPQSLRRRLGPRPRCGERIAQPTADGPPEKPGRVSRTY